MGAGQSPVTFGHSPSFVARSDDAPSLVPEKVLRTAPSLLHSRSVTRSVGGGWMRQSEEKGNGEAAPLVYHDKKDALAAHEKGKAEGVLARTVLQFERATRRSNNSVSWGIFFLGCFLLALFVIGSILLSQQELCRYPPETKMETFSYDIDLSLAQVSVLSSASVGGQTKEYSLKGPKLEEINIDAKYATVKIVSEDSTNNTVFKIEVNNRARSQEALGTMTNWNYTIDTYNAGVGAALVSERRAKVFLTSATNNRQTGADSCQLAEIEVIVPSQCMLLDSILKINIENAQSILLDKSFSSASMNEIVVKNTHGVIYGNGGAGTKVTLETADGKLLVTALSGHEIFLKGTEDGVEMDASDIKLETGDANCYQGVAVKPGFTNEVAVMICDTVPGTLTIDSQGADLGAKNAAVMLKDISGGHIVANIKVGNMRLTQTACTSFVGDYAVLTGAGKVDVLVNTAPVGSYPILLDGTTPTAQDRQMARMNYGMEGVTSAYFWKGETCDTGALTAAKGNLPTPAPNAIPGTKAPIATACTRNALAGSICKGYVDTPPNQATNQLNIQSITTGNLELIVAQPFKLKEEL